jgi:hypothetical protein
MLQDLSCINFTEGSKVQKLILSSLLPRSTYKDSIEIYFLVLQVLFHFLHILEVYMNFWNYKRK